jgi:sugar lactone lactonase YvrE
MTTIDCVLRQPALLGESPIWSEAEQALFFVDIHRPAIHRFKPSDGGLTAWPLTENVGSIGLRQAGGLVAALRRNFAELDTTNGALAVIEPAVFDAADLRFNDGRCDRSGRFWAGTVEEKRRPGLAALYCLDADGRSRKVIDGLTVSNGISWSPDDQVMYLADSHARAVYAFDFDLAEGHINNRRLFAQFSEGVGVPDGAAVDADGCYWIAHFDGWRISRYTPAGVLDRTIEFPVPRPTSCTFGGPGLRTLYVTSASFNLSPAQLAAAPLSGCLFALNVGVQGLAEPAFGVSDTPHGAKL